MILSTILALAAIFGLAWPSKSTFTLPRLISWGMAVAVLWFIVAGDRLRHYGLYTYMAFVGLSFAYGLRKLPVSVFSGIVVALMSASIFAYWLWVLNHWHGNALLLPSLTLLTGVVAVAGKARLRNELGFLVIMAADALAILLEYWMKMP
ncbi:MAG: hypothetical protein KGZ82_06555 [Bacteroidales bacterium]|nr:hypothetical protein [Bacteroidales bacterium]